MTAVLGALYHVVLLLGEASVIWYILTTDLGQRVVDWLFRKGRR